MKAFLERRSVQRRLHKSAIDLCRMDYKDVIYHAEMIDYCDTGLSLMTNEKLVLGELISLKLKTCDPDISIPIKKQNYNGIVRWGKRFSSTRTEDTCRYKYGIELSV